MNGFFKFLARAMSHKTGRAAAAMMVASVFSDKIPGPVGEVVAAILNPEIVVPLGTLAVYGRDRQAKVDRGES